MIMASFFGAAVWLFVSSSPSPVAWVLAWLLISYTFLGYLFLEVCIYELENPRHPKPANAADVQPLLESLHTITDPEISENMKRAAKAWGMDKKKNGR